VGVVDRGGELDEPVEELLVVGAGFEVEPAVLPRVVGGVVLARVVDGDARPEVVVHARAIRCRRASDFGLRRGRLATLVVVASRQKRPDGGSRECSEREPRQVANAVSVLTEI